MSQRGAEMLCQVYHVEPGKIAVIPHGIPDLPFCDTSDYKRRHGLANRTVILTFGLVSRNKGIEVMLNAMTSIVARIPDALYIVLGATHPNVLECEGEAYRRTLEQKVNDLGLDRHVVFCNEFVDDHKLHDFLQMTDFYVTPYLSERQIVSGTLAFALGTGRAIISTPYWYAQELLAGGHGRLVPFNDPEAITQAIVDLNNRPQEHLRLRRSAYLKGRTMTWPTIGRAYWRLFGTAGLGDKKARMLPLRASDARSVHRDRCMTTGSASKGDRVNR